ncbi:uncharacterized protein F4822DRAFT_90748 [Hypoxylon trugodes]|uniref:uncharacterized protein n=1 Tax=Hypoxylon trugodes TaxID=326681 RepID=UPI00219D59FD|nr:uncharacterized protein F4822DRAFT_90748 [Hypoxylon trugodes]KAI1383037.1 hypothetical protein F4822DRAFT_90748 [Hypoxylon trugodes]
MDISDNLVVQSLSYTPSLFYCTIDLVSSAASLLLHITSHESFPCQGCVFIHIHRSDQHWNYFRAIHDFLTILTFVRFTIPHLTLVRLISFSGCHTGLLSRCRYTIDRSRSYMFHLWIIGYSRSFATFEGSLVLIVFIYTSVDIHKRVTSSRDGW